MYTKRHIVESLRTALAQFPAVLVTGPRQSGKTTVLRAELGNDYVYTSFDDPLMREFARHDPRGFLSTHAASNAILDEIQYVPELVPYIKMAIDQDRQRNGRWVLTGSQQFALMREVNESLAGRVALLELLPFALDEFALANSTLENLLWNGQYPEPALNPQKRDLWMSSYVQTYIERDIRLLHNVQNLRLFEQFVGLCAARHGQEFNKAAIARECGISESTANSWAGLLQATYVVTLLPTYFQNFGKRLIKSPKLYFIDSGIVCNLTRQSSGAAALAGQSGGALFEGLVITEALKTYANRARKPNVFFWRSHDGLEVDLIIQERGTLYPVEIKLTATPTLRHIEPLNRFRALAKLNRDKVPGILVCQVERRTVLPDNTIALPYREFAPWLATLISG